MRVVMVVIAALMTLGVAAFGVVAAQKAAGPKERQLSRGLWDSS
jgi:hypothetical protein